MPVEALETRQAESVVLDVRDHTRACKQRNAAARIGQHPADEATDTAGSGHADRPARIHVAFTPSLFFACGVRSEHARPLQRPPTWTLSLDLQRRAAPCNRPTTTLCF